MDNRIKLGVFFILFSALSLLFYNVDVAYVVGAEEQSFSMFQFIGPTGAGLINPLVGIAAVLLVEVLEKGVFNEFTFSAFNLLRFFPMLAAAYYFGAVGRGKGAGRKFGIALPLAGMVLFWAHPVGAEAWGYAFLWLIPIAATCVAERHVFLRSLGATFQAHIVGSVAFLYTIGMPAAAWWALIPIVLVERGIFAAGISVTYVALQSVLDFVAQMLKWDMGFLNAEGKFVPHAHKEKEE
jgi:hypothetical protein